MLEFILAYLQRSVGSDLCGLRMDMQKFGGVMASRLRIFHGDGLPDVVVCGRKWIFAWTILIGLVELVIELKLAN